MVDSELLTVMIVVLIVSLFDEPEMVISALFISSAAVAICFKASWDAERRCVAIELLLIIELSRRLSRLRSTTVEVLLPSSAPISA